VAMKAMKEAMKAMKEAMNGAEVRGFARGSWVVLAGRSARRCWKEERIAWEQQKGQADIPSCDFR